MSAYYYNIEDLAKNTKPDFAKDYPLLVKYKDYHNLPRQEADGSGGFSNGPIYREWHEQKELADKKDSDWMYEYIHNHFIEELKSTRKNKQHLIDLFHYFFINDWEFHKYMWKPFSTQNLVDVRTIIHDYFAADNFNTIVKSKANKVNHNKYFYPTVPKTAHQCSIHLLGSFDNIKELNEHMNDDFLLSLKDMQRDDLDFRNVWESLRTLAYFYHENNKYGAIWHNVVPNAIDVRVNNKSIGIVTRDQFCPQDAQWETSKYHKVAYLDQKLKGNI